MGNKRVSMSRGQSEAHLAEALLLPETKRVKEGDATELHHLIVVAFFVILAVVMGQILQSRVGLWAAVAGILISSIARVGTRGVTKALYIIVLIEAWVIVGHVFEIVHLGFVSLLVFAGCVLFILRGF